MSSSARLCLHTGRKFDAEARRKARSDYKKDWLARHSHCRAGTVSAMRYASSTSTLVALAPGAHGAPLRGTRGRVNISRNEVRGIRIAPRMV